MNALLTVIVTLACIGGFYLLLAGMWWLAAEPCRRCGKRHWSYDTARRCLHESEGRET